MTIKPPDKQPAAETTKEALEPGAGGHVHRFNAVRVPPEFGHSYLRCAYCGLSKHLESHDASTCDICSRVSACDRWVQCGDHVHYESVVNCSCAAPASPAAPRDEADELVDEVQHRMDQVVDAAVEWHQAGREGGEWFEAVEKLGAAINSLLELRGDPNNMPRRWCSVHNCEEFKYESLEHELQARRAGECFCGVDLEAGVCPNGHDPIKPPVTATTPPSTLAKAAAEEINAYYNRLVGFNIRVKGVEEVTAIIERCLAGGGESK